MMPTGSKQIGSAGQAWQKTHVLPQGAAVFELNFMLIDIDLQLAVESEDNLPAIEELETWARAALTEAGYDADSEITVRVVESAEIQELNATYRHIDRPTNILSFPFECPPEVQLPLLGDLILCKEIVEREAVEQHKTLKAHYAHLIIHGCLHLLGFDHIEDAEAEEMEGHEIKALAALGFKNPYEG